MENATNASTVGGGASSRKHSSDQRRAGSLMGDSKAPSEGSALDSEHVDGIESSDDEEYQEGTAQQYISPIEVQDHIRKLWAKEIELLGLLYGKYDASAPF